MAAVQVGGRVLILRAVDALTSGTTLLSPDGQALTVDAALAAAYRPGDRLIANPVGGLMHIPAAELAASRTAVDAAASAFAAMHDVPDDAIVPAMRQMARTEGIDACPEGAASLAGLRRLLADGVLDGDARIVLFNTGSGYKYAEAWQAALAT